MATEQESRSVRLQRDLLALLLRRGVVAFLVQLLASVLACLVLFPAVPGTGLPLALGLVALASGGGLLICLRPPDLRRYQGLCRSLLYLAALATGSGWAFAIGAGLWSISEPHELIVLLALAGLVGGAATNFDADPRAFLLFTFPIVVTISFTILGGGEDLGGWVSAVVTIVLFLVALATLVHMHQGRRGHLEATYEVEEGRQELLETNRSLAAATARAEAAAAAKQGILATLGHEVRTPLNGVIGISEILLEENLPEEQRETVSLLRQSGESLMNLVNDILDFSKLEAGKMVLDEIEFDVVDLVESLVDQFAEQAARKRLEIAASAQPGVPRLVRGDPGRLRQVLINFVGNAIRFTAKGEILVRVSRGPQGEAPNLIRFEVRDTGIGIAREAHERIFEPFTQADSSTARHFGGTGLGLSISRQLCDLMRGRIGVESEPGRGSTFWLVVPLEPSAHEGEPELTPAGLEGFRALVVDDNLATRTVIEERLSGWGCRVTGALSAEEAIPLLGEAAREEDPFLLVLMDKILPGMDGFEATRAIRRDPLLEKSCVVLITGFGLRGDAARARDAGCAAYLPKPVRTSRFREEILHVLARREAGEEDALFTRFTAGRPVTRKGRILVLDDQPVNRRVAEMLLRNRGHEVVCSQEGSEAMDILARHPFDLLLLDINMPGMGGIEVTRAIRGDRWLGRLPVVAMTGGHLPEERNRIVHAGFDAVLGRPIVPAELDTLLARYLGPETGADGSAPESRDRATCGQDGEGPLDGKTKMNSDGKPVLDWERALERSLGDEEFLRETFVLFLECAEEQVHRISEAVERGDLRALRENAHSLKGSAATVGAERLSLTARGLEEAATASDLESARRGLTELGSEAALAFRTVRAWVRGERSGSGAPGGFSAGARKH